MASYGDVLASLRDFRNDLEQQTQEEMAAQFAPGGEPMRVFAAFEGTAAFSTPLANVHATGVGIRVRRGQVVPDEFVLKVYVFTKLPLGDQTPALTRSY